ncbi:MAG: UDP-N-acetylmuramate dehydrogenase [Clostridiales Family XIII bacterium]|nr:UDP-N-acetylmuramate dehydrogenase [Clostridiales Family XIII bacterium]
MKDFASTLLRDWGAAFDGPLPVSENEPMAAHTSFRCGGAARLFCRPSSEAELIFFLKAVRTAGVPFFILGNGTNVLVRDGGFGGAVVSTAGAGVPAAAPLASAAKGAADAGKTGLEPLSGIPGSVGGAVRMNAGAYGGEMAQVVAGVRVYDMDSGNIIIVNREDCAFGYRASVFQQRPWVVLEAEWALADGDPAEIRARMQEYARRRNEKQPMDLPSAGSFFKRPAGGYASQLIDEAGLKGFRVGGAMVSEKHAGFLVNAGGATASDVLAVADHVKEVVLARFGILLEEEPEVLG